MNKENVLKSIKEVISYLSKGCVDFPLLFLKDDKSVKDKEPKIDSIDLNDLEGQVEIITTLNEEYGMGVFFYPNGSTRDREIKGVSWHFVDIDDGTKESQFERIQNAPLTPTLVYRGRAGHKLLYRVTEAYWNYSSDQSLKESIVHFKNVQQQLIDYFDGDSSVINPAHALRLPFTKNFKNPNEVFEEVIISFNPDCIYSQKQLRDAFPITNKIHELNNTLEPFTEETREKNEVFQSLIHHLVENQLICHDRGDRLSFQCPVHDDTSPSAYMFKNNLIVHCAKGKSSGECEIGNGKDLDWLARRMNWGDLKQKWNKFIGIKEGNYNDIDLCRMTSYSDYPLNEVNDVKSKLIIDGAVNKLKEVMKQRGITFDNELETIYRNMIHYCLGENSTPIAYPLPPGGGKSTFIETFLTYLLENYIELAGAVIAVERLDTARKLADSFEYFYNYKGGAGVDLPFYEPSKSAYVMESAFSSNRCKKELIEYKHGICRGCNEVQTCPIPRKYHDQKHHPIVIISHARLSMENIAIDNYSKWVDHNGKEHLRKLLFIDEKPSFVNVHALKVSDFLEAEHEIKKMATDIKDNGNSALIMLSKIKKQFDTSMEIFSPINPNFNFDFYSTWIKKYSGSNVGLLKQIEILIQSGGRVSIIGTKKKVYITNKIQYNFTGYRTLIMDGTCHVDMEYYADRKIARTKISGFREYKSLTFKIANKSLSKQAIYNNPTNIQTLVNEVKGLCLHEKVFLLCNKSDEINFKKQLFDELNKNQVMINHYGNVKGSNDYSTCTSMVISGIQHKGDQYYLTKYENLYGQPISSYCVTLNGVRRFKDNNLECFRVNDQVVGLIQDINRTKIRFKDSIDQITVYIPTKDRILVKVLSEYFIGCKQEVWEFDGIEKIPDWYKVLEGIFSKLVLGEKVYKKKISSALNLVDEAGKRKFSRMQKKRMYLELLEKNNIKPYNSKCYIKD